MTNSEGWHPFFVVAPARSGTTLVRVMLNRHPELAIPAEGRIIPHLWDHRRRYGTRARITRPDAFLADLHEDPAFRHWGIDLAGVRDELGKTDAPTLVDGIAAVYRAYARHHGKTLWADKTPEYIDHLPLLFRLFPSARIVFVARDGRDVALSTIDLNRLHRHAASVALVWRLQVKRAMSSARRFPDEQFYTLSYEKLVSSPEPVMRELFDFLELRLDESVLVHDDTALDSIPESFRKIHGRLALPPTPGLRDWRTQMTPHETAEFEAIAGPTLESLGYELSRTPTLRDRLAAWWRVALFLVRLARRRVLRLVHKH